MVSCAAEQDFWKRLATDMQCAHRGGTKRRVMLRRLVLPIQITTATLRTVGASRSQGRHNPDMAHTPRVLHALCMVYGYGVL
jgi:hypothetical protein